MLRPLLVTNDFLPAIGGIQQYVSQIAARLDDVGVFAPAHSAADDASLGYPVWRGHRRYLWPTAATLRSLRAAVAEHRATVVVFMAPAPLTPLGPAVGLPWAVCAHGAELVLPARTPLVRRAYAAVLRRADQVFAVSEYTAAAVRTLVGDDGPPVGLVRNGVDVQRFHPRVDATALRRRHGLGPSEPVVVTVGRLVPRKGQDRLIAALPLVRATLPDTRLLIVGGGRDLRRLRRRARRAGGAVVFTGSVNWSQLPAYYCAGDVFAHPNRSRWGGLEQEGFGVVFLEAQACGVPVVAGRSGGSPEALCDGVTGLLVDGRDVEQIAEAIITLLRESEETARMGLAARDWVVRGWTWDAIVEGFADDLRRLASAV